MQLFHLVGPDPYYTNSFVLVGSGGNAVVIDPAASPQEYERLLQRLGASVVQILCTHGHFDHVGAAAALKRRWQCPLLCEPQDVRGDRYYPLSESDGGFAEAQPFVVDDMEFTAWHTPGHTPGSVVLYCRGVGSQEAGCLFTGDTLFAGSMGRTDLPGGDGEQMLLSLRKLDGLPVPPLAQVLPGHGESSTLQQEQKTNYYLRASRA